MKITLFTTKLAVVLTVQLTTLQAQTLFLENFETSPVTSILNSGETQLINGTSPCGKGTRGNTTDFNSTNMSFNNTQNPTYFLGVNPETPCGGYYTATLNTTSLNFSGQDSLHFHCRYFKSTTLGWGSTLLEITFSNGTSNFSVNSEFSVTDNWTYLDIALPNFLIAPAVTITINQMGGGEGVGLDDIEVVNISTTGIEQYNSDNIKLYPNPFNNDITIVQLFQKSSELTIYNIM